MSEQMSKEMAAEKERDMETEDGPAQKPAPREVLKRAAISFVLLNVGLCLIGGVGVLFLFDGAVGDAEADLLGWIADNRVDVLDSVFTVASALSDTWTVVGVTVGAASMLWVTGHGRHAATILIALALEFFTFLVVGAIVGRERPDVETLHSVPSTPSFPSGHTAAAFMLYGSLILVARSMSPRPGTPSTPPWVWVVPSIIAVVVAVARVYEGVHNPIDVAAGLLLGIGALVGAGLSTGIIDPPRRRGAPERVPAVVTIEHHGDGVSRTHIRNSMEDD
mgnify:CR=1 FL=1